MPFLVAKLDRASYDRDRDAVRNAIRNFGARGGGVFSKSMEIELLQAASGGGDVYRNIISYMGEAITKVILGQLASSDKASGLSGGDVQSRVRQDILEADARKMETTLRAQLAVPWTSFHYEAGTPVPVLQFQVTPPEDLSAFAQTLKELHGAGLDADPEEIGKRFGLHLERKEDNV
jgi:phage gp29-like protein